MPHRLLCGAAAVLCAAPLAYCQDAKPPDFHEIRGVVLATGTNQPVADALIALYFLGAESPKIRTGTGLLQKTASTRSDFSGAFSFRVEKPGYYSVAANKENYGSPVSASSSADLAMGATEPVKDVRLFLSIPGHLTGRVVDDETGKPLSGIRVTAGRATNFAGSRRFMGPGGITNADGQFVIPNLEPGEYVAIVLPQKQGKERVIANFLEKDLETVDRDLHLSYWPGGHGQDAAIPVLVGGGSTISVGEARVNLRPYYRVHARIPAANCGPGETMLVYDQVGGSGMEEIAADAPCGKDMLLAGFSPGEHRLILASGGGRGKRAMASVPFSIGDKNVEIAAPMTTGITVTANFEAADGAKPPDFAKMGLTLYPVGMIPFIDLASPQSPDSSGRITLTGVPMVRHRIMFSGLDAGHYVQEIRFNGVPISEYNLPLDQGAMSSSLTVAIDDKPVTISGSVVKDEKPVSQPFILLVKWPPPADWPIQYLRTTGDEKGRFQFAGVAPGEYRMVAVASRAEEQNRAPGSLERALAAAKKIEAGARALLSVTLELIKLQ